MSAASSLTHRRARLLLMIAPGLLVILGAMLAYGFRFEIAGLGFGKVRLLVTTLLGTILLFGGVVVHRKAVADFHIVERAYWKTALFVTGSVFLGPLLAVFVLDQAIGLYLRVSPPAPILVLQPNFKVSYRTSEFHFTAQTNALGFRDHEVDLQGKAKLRVLAIGDSFTYGWGVELADSWPKVVERRLTAAGKDVEVLNLGCPGASVDAYAEIAERAIPLLKPDLVLVAVLQGIDVKLLDLGTTANRLFRFNVDENSRYTPKILPRVLPRWYELRGSLTARRRRVTSAEEVREEWRRMAAWMPDRLTPVEKARFDSLDAEVKAMLLGGDLNPWEIYFSIKYPDYVSFTLRPEREEVRRAGAAMASSLDRIKQACAKGNVKGMVWSVPPAWYVSPKALASKRRVGYVLDDTALSSDAPDELIRSACRTAGLEFHSCTSRFRALDAERKWYFDFDGMFNADGQALYGEEVSRKLSRPIN